MIADVKQKTRVGRDSEIQAELVRIKNKHSGTLRPADVVEAAKTPKSVLHSCFDWDNESAGYAYRLEQARHLIRRYYIVTVPDPKFATPIRRFVSLTTDQKRPGGGYRDIEVVMANERMYDQLLADLHRDYLVFKRKYQVIAKLRDAFGVMDKAIDKLMHKKPIKKAGPSA